MRTIRATSHWIEASRPKTLPAAVIPVLVGSALAHRAGAFQPVPALVCLAFALLVQIGTNFANDHGDFVKGADREDRLGPRRAVSSGLVSARAMAIATALVFGTAFVVGLSLIRWGGWALLPVGVASLLFGWAYTSGPFPLAYRGLGDVFVFIFFGLVAVGGTFFVLTGTLPWATWLAATPVGLLATNILVVNNHRDADTDARANKRTTVVRFGRGFARRQYIVSFVIAFFIPAVFAILWRDPLLLAPLLAGPWAIALTRRLTPSASGPELNALLAKTAQLLLLFGILWSVALCAL